jgi:hypothetical protein
MGFFEFAWVCAVYGGMQDEPLFLLKNHSKSHQFINYSYAIIAQLREYANTRIAKMASIEFLKLK